MGKSGVIDLCPELDVQLSHMLSGDIEIEKGNAQAKAISNPDNIYHPIMFITK